MWNNTRVPYHVISLLGTCHDLIVSSDEEDLTMMLNVSMGDTIGCCFPLLKNRA